MVGSMAQAFGECLDLKEGEAPDRPIAPALSAPTISSSARVLEAPVEQHLYVCRVLTCRDSVDCNWGILK
jgi:hypothetical protein